MSHGFEMPGAAVARPAVPASAPVAWLAAFLQGYHRVAVFLGMIALLVTSCILTYSVVVRYFFHQPTDWQDEASVFMLVGVIFLCSGYVQSLRGHIGIEALAGMLSPLANKVRMFIVDVLSFLFCAFFTWKSWTLFHEAWAEGQTTSSTFAPPLWIPYSLMALGMTMLTLQLLVQVLTRITGTVPAAQSGGAQ
ncbi:TRAP-type C4-dicarboxylate transport system small permease [Herbaspirillum sp. GW103]|uniref:TRAP transporter small permease n=1 Tax=unclassified Herbaspirillum TaxID=2624150 RepID=UPI00025E47F8|nr:MULTISPECIES: TRAP transporter small permease [unclassified Herbaspirillum]EIJ47907.1 TRAP-type C4-dicarboxylate transport system small permease [Herbaspirillum sp. GW103]MCI1005900.1 TRAP transporter small permease [Herbaspirillum sp. C7C8]NUT61800.1 TRAP transporter small permease [Herbaspirillum sp. C9C3]